MNADFYRVIGASLEERRGLFLATANRLGTPLQNVEKDFWVCYVLDLLFNGREAGEPRLLFKGGTSLSKAYGLISRFSEDIDITVFREDIGQDIEVGDLEGLSGKQQRVRLDAIKQACRNYVQGQLKDRLNGQIEAHFRAAKIAFAAPPVVQDHDDPDQQTLLLHYPSVIPGADDYVKPSVKIEAGARSALDPHRSTSIEPYVAGDMAASNFIVLGVVTIDAERTLWDKVVILHGLRRWHDSRGVLRQNGHRVSRHYYDIHKLFHSSLGQGALSDRALAADCTRHALMFFNSPDLDLRHAQPGSYTIMPAPEMLDALKRDYQAMAGMIFGDVPDFTEILETVRQLELIINDAP
ncbi:MAG: nucleotidyl transferase AbiEii/AbiGii toxin family protein [Pseudomonadota bacterium]